MAPGDLRGMICGVTAAGSVEEMVRAGLVAGTGLVELRVDLLADPLASMDALADAIRVLEGSGRRVIVTLREAGEGGGFEGSAGEKLYILTSLLEAGPSYVDVELSYQYFDRVREAAVDAGASIIGSAHVFTGPLDAGEILALAHRILARGGPGGGEGRVIAKVVYTCETPSDGLPALEAVRSLGGRLVSFGMGRRCLYTRLLAPFAGAPFTYAHAGGGPVAEGQPSVEEVVRAWRMLGLA